MKSHRLLAHSGLAALLALIALPSHAVVISDNNPYAFAWNYDSQSAAGILSGNGTLTVSGFNSNQLTVAVTLNNTSSPASDRLTAFGFGIDPNATGVSWLDVSDSGLINATLSSIPGLGTIEVCAWGGNNCAGGANGGIYGGASDSFALRLSGTWGSSVNINPIGFKYQTGAGSFEFTAPPTSVPEPMTSALLGLGLLGAAFARRRRNAA